MPYKDKNKYRERDKKRWAKIKDNPELHFQYLQRRRRIYNENTLLSAGAGIRFNILSRDKFTCQYCGRKAPDVVLEIDHIIPKSKGGLNRLDNLITACRECNIGKSNKSL